MNRELLKRVIPSPLRQLRRRWFADRSVLAILNGKHGHGRSVDEQAIVDAEGNPTPWYTYPAIEYLKQLDFMGATVFEWGSGYSTLYWRAHARRVISVEHDPHWYREIGAKFGDQRVIEHRLELQQERDQYVNALQSSALQPDIIVIDGLYRALCAKAAATHLKDGGFIIFDNSDWFPKTCAGLRDCDLIQVDFHGMGAINHFQWTTSLFLHRNFRPKPKADRLPLFSAGGVEQLWDDTETLGR